MGHGKPIGIFRLIAASIKLVSPWHVIRRPKPAHASLDTADMQASIAKNDARAQRLRSEVAQDLLLIPATQDPGALTAATDEILLHRAAQIYPARPRRDERISQDPQFSTRARELWRLYKDYRAIGRCTQQTVLSKWRLWVQFRKASKQMRDSVKEVKRREVKAIMLELEQAASKGDQAGTYAAVRRLAPWKPARNPASAVPQGSFSRLLSNSRHYSRTPKRSSVRAWISYRRGLCAKAS